MSNFYQPASQPNQNLQPSANNLQFYPSSYSTTPSQFSGGAVSGHSTPSQAGYYGAANSQPGFGGFGGNAAFGAAGVSGQMGHQAGLRTGWLAAFGTEGYEHEPGLLEELEVNFPHILAKTMTVLNPFARIDQHIMDDSDLAGPILFLLLYGVFLALSSRIAAGYIYGLVGTGVIGLHTILSLMSPSQPSTQQQSSYAEPSPSYHSGTATGSQSGGHLSGTLTVWRSASVLGYCLLPLVLTSFFGIALPMDSFAGYIITFAAIFWCTYSSSGMFCTVGRMEGMRALVAYPLMLFYFGFGIMTIFGSRGSGTMAKKAGL